MAVPSNLRIFLVALAAVLLWRLGSGGVLALLAPLLLALGAAGEAALLERYDRLCPGYVAAVHNREELRRLSSADAARHWPWVVACCAALAWFLALLYPTRVPLDIACTLLALAHGTVFRGAMFLTWPDAAVQAGWAWRARVTPPALLRLAAARTVLLAKRGLLSSGEVWVGEIATLDPELRDDDVLRLAAALVRQERSGLAQVVLEAARHRRLALPKLADLRRDLTAGRVGAGDDHLWRLAGPGATALPQELTDALDAGEEVLVLYRDDVAVGALALGDPRRAEAAGLAAALRQAGVACVAAFTDGEAEGADRDAARWGLDTVLPQVAEGLDQHPGFATLPAPVVVVVPPTLAGLVPEPVVRLVIGGEASRPDEPAPAELTRLPGAWRAARGAVNRDRRQTRALLATGALLLLGAALQLPLALLVLLDELVILSVLGRYVQRAEALGSGAAAAAAA